MAAPAIFEKQIEIKLLHSASTEGVTDSGLRFPIFKLKYSRNKNTKAFKAVRYVLTEQ
jgi:hypothetical protein